MEPGEVRFISSPGTMKGAPRRCSLLSMNFKVSNGLKRFTGLLLLSKQP